jgi:uncharacterized protein
MWCAVYKSPRRAETYLYVRSRDQFSDVPPPLLAQLGRPQFVLVCNLDKRSSLGVADLATVKQALAEQGYYLQLPPPPENLLEQLKRERAAAMEQGSCAG